MKQHFVRELEANQQVVTTFLVHHKEVRQKKSGEPYLSLVLADRTGDLDAKMWDNVAEIVDTFDRDDFIKIKGLMQIFQNRPQLTIFKLSRVDEQEIAPADYFPASRRDPEQMFAELRGMIEGMSNPHLKGLLNAMLDDPEIGRLYKLAPAAKTIHHAFLGGLLEHVLSLANLARHTSAHYDFVDPDLLLTGVVLHDIGKIYELQYARSFGYSDDGQLLGHIIIALRMIGDKVRDLPDFPPKLRVLVEHLVVSHHGELEFGSPKVPVFPEALLLHHLDNMDSKMESMRNLIDRDKLVEGNWTSYSASLERTALKKSKYLAETAPASAAAAPQNGQVDTAASPKPVFGGARTPAPPKQAPPKPQNNSLFADKLQGALHKE